MDSNNVQPAGAFASSQYATDTMNADMDIDMDIDLTTADDIDAFDTEGITIVRLQRTALHRPLSR